MNAVSLLLPVLIMVYILPVEIAPTMFVISVPTSPATYIPLTFVEIHGSHLLTVLAIGLSYVSIPRPLTRSSATYIPLTFVEIHGSHLLTVLAIGLSYVSIPRPLTRSSATSVVGGLCTRKPKYTFPRSSRTTSTPTCPAGSRH